MTSRSKPLQPRSSVGVAGVKTVLGPALIAGPAVLIDRELGLSPQPTPYVQAHLPSPQLRKGLLQYYMPGCVCWGSGNASLSSQAHYEGRFGKKNKHIEGILCTLHTHIMV